MSPSTPNRAVIVGVALALATLIFPASRARALDPDKRLDQYAIEVWPGRAGLPGTWVRALAQTREGYLWVGTYGGLARYDGARLWTLPATPPFHNLRDIMNLEVGPDDTLWVIPASGPPVCVREGVPKACLPQKIAWHRHDRLVDVAPTATGAWLLARQRLLHLTEAGLAPVVTPPFSRGTVVHQDGRGRVWLGTTEGLFVRDGQSFVRFDLGAKAGLAEVHAIFEEPKGQIWFGTSEGLLELAGETRRLHTRAQGLPAERVLHIGRDGEGSLWLGTPAGLVRKRGKHFELFTRRDGLPHDEVTAVLEDQEGSLWVGTRVGGIAQLTDRTVDAMAGPPSLQSGQWVDTVSQDAGGAMWFGHSGGAVRWRQGQERRFGPEDGLPGQHVYAFAPAPDGALWIGTSEGLARLRGDRVEWSLRIGAGVETLRLDDDGSLWLGLEGGVLGRLTGHEVVRHPAEDPERIGNVRALVRDKSGVLWVGGSRGLGRFDGQRVVADLPHVPAVRSLHLDAQGRLWVTTSRGLLAIVAGRRHPIPMVHGSFGGHLYQSVTDAFGNLWIGTNTGLLRLRESQLDGVLAGRSETVHPLILDVTDQRRDVTAMSARAPSAWRDRSGRLWFASDQGVLSVDPTKLRINTRPPTVRIDEAVIDGRAVARGQKAVLPPGPGNLAFRFSAVTLLEPRKSVHRYRLEGFDPGWVDAGGRRVASYTNIPPGHYRFRVKGSNADGVWSPEGDVIEFSIRPHFTDTVWFYAALAGVFFGAIGLVYRLRVRSLRRQYLAVFAERTRVARELHDTLLQGMSAVGLQIRAIRRRLTDKEPDTAAKLESVERLVSSSLAETRQFLGDLREHPAAGGDLRVALGRLLGRLLAGRSETHAVEVVGETWQLPDDVKDVLFRIAQEAVSNALKHAGATHLDIRLEYARDTVRMAVRDNGSGFEATGVRGPESGHYGLLGMRERAARIGSLTIHTAPGKGTEVEVLTSPIQKHEP